MEFDAITLQTVRSHIAVAYAMVYTLVREKRVWGTLLFYITGMNLTSGETNNACSQYGRIVD